MKTVLSTKENKSPGDGPFPLVTSETDVLRHKITFYWGIFVAEVRGTQRADDERCLCRQKESITQPVDKPALSCHSRHHQPAFCHRHQKKAIGWILFVCQIWPFFSWHRSDHCNCIVLPCCLSFNQPGYILQAKLKFVEDLFVCSSWPLPNQIKLKLTTNSKLIKASDVVLNWLWFLKMQSDHLAFLCSTSRLVPNATFPPNIGVIEWS